jgi:signal transduction histidine kinase
VTAWYTALLCLLFVLLGGALVELNHTLRLNVLQSDLQQQARKAAREPYRFDPFDDGVYTILYDSDGRILRGNLPQGMPGAEKLPFRGEGPREFAANGRTYHYEDRPVAEKDLMPRKKDKEGGPFRPLPPSPGRNYWVRSISTETAASKDAVTLIRTFLILMPCFILLAALGGYLIIKRGFRPVEVISATARRIGEEQDLSRRIELAPGKDELHQMAQTFNTMLDQIEASMEREKRFSSDVSHELRTPVAAIMAESEYAGTYVESVDEAKESFRTIHGQSKRMALLIQQLLELARLEKPDAVQKETIDWVHVTEDALQDYRLLYDQHGTTLTTKVLPDSALVLGNAVLLQRALGNLLDNALKFAHSSVSLTLEDRGRLYRLSVQDDGPGLRPEEAARVWDRFYQTDASRNHMKNRGMGLGLSFTALVMAIHGGKCSVVSTPGKGSTFLLELPKA